MSRVKMKCFNPSCKCANIKLERVLKIRCKNCHCSIIYDIENIEFIENAFSASEIKLASDSLFVD